MRLFFSWLFTKTGDRRKIKRGGKYFLMLYHRIYSRKAKEDIPESFILKGITDTVIIRQVRIMGDSTGGIKDCSVKYHCVLGWESSVNLQRSCPSTCLCIA